MAQPESHNAPNTLWSEKFELLPLKQRLKLLLASNRIPVDSDVKSEKILKTGYLGSFNHEKNQESKYGDLTAAAISERAASVETISLQESQVVQDPLKVKIECDDNNVESRMGHSAYRAQANSEAKPSIEVLDELDRVVLKDRLKMLLKSELGLSSPFLEASPNLSGDSSNEHTPDIPRYQNVKVEPQNLDEFRSSNITSVGQTTSFVLLKTEVQSSDEAHDEDELDHMLLSQRIKLLSSRDGPSLKTDQSPRSMSKNPASYCRPFQLKPGQSLKINRPRKRRKTVTDSVETAMEEDAPGLLQVLIEKGVTVDEIKLFGEPESNDALDESSANGSFDELEEVIEKLFSHRESLLKYAPLRCPRGEKANYCLECLFSLVEQARYMQFRNLPVEWGWCRDLQSFIFVFKKHNRIVLERPEYGYATYFFELTDVLPVGWQVKRLVISMKLISCSRITLIENKPLMVGDDLSEAEAKVLIEYGWIPNTGLGTMLNYYDRVVHDRRNEKDGSEWKMKIGKLLVDGYEGGTLIPSVIPTKVLECNAANEVRVKQEV